MKLLEMWNRKMRERRYRRSLYYVQNLKEIHPGEGSIDEVNKDKRRILQAGVLALAGRVVGEDIFNLFKLEVEQEVHPRTVGKLMYDYANVVLLSRHVNHPDIHVAEEIYPRSSPPENPLYYKKISLSSSLATTHVAIDAYFRSKDRDDVLLKEAQRVNISITKDNKKIAYSIYYVASEALILKKEDDKEPEGWIAPYNPR